MNKTLETIRGSWITRARETVEANRVILYNSLDQIPAELREKFLSVVEWADRLRLLPANIRAQGAILPCKCCVSK